MSDWDSGFLGFRKSSFSGADKADMVNHPPHYKDASGIECIEVTSKMQFCGGNCFKYLYRAGKKSSTIEDLKKAAWYASRAAKNDRVVSDDDYASNIRAVASHRAEAIKNAMLAVKDGYWWTAEQFINAEIARLESE